MSESVTVLLMLEAIDKASQILEGISGKLDAMGEAAQAAADKAALTGDALEAAQVKAEAAANAYAAAVDQETAAQARLLESTQAVRDAQESAASAAAQLAEADQAIAAGAEEAAGAAQASYAEISAAAESSAAAAKAAVAEQVASLDALSAAQKESAARADESAAATDAANTSVDASGTLMKGAAMGAALTAAAVAGIGYESIKAAGNFQSLTEHLVTDAGESQANLAKVQAGILSISTATGTSTTDLVNGMYHIESAGYHGAAGLTMLTTAAEGAKVGGADLDTVSKALVGTMNAYGASAGQSTSYMNQLIATVGAGDMRMQDLASSMSSVTAAAAAAHISFAQVGGAIATMTAQGMSANQATQDLSHTIGAMSNPNSVQIAEMQAMGLSSNQVAQDLGKQGLTGTFQELTAAVAKHVQGGQVLISTFQSSQQAAADANTMIKAMPSSLEKLADAYLSGSVTQLQWTNDLKGLPPIQAKMMGQFATLADKTHAFNAQLASGSPAAQTYNAAMSKMMGGTVGLNTALMLTGTHAATFSQNVATVSAAAASGGSSVANWAAIQGTMNQKLDQLKASVQAAAIGLGTALIPMVTKILGVVMKVVTPIADWIDHNQKLAAVILLVVGGLAVFVTTMVAAAKVISIVKDAYTVLGGALGGAKAAISGIGDAMSSAASTASELASSAGSAIASFASSAWSGATSLVSSLGEALVSAASATAEWVASATAAAASAAREAVAWTADKIALIATTVVEKAAAAAQFLLDAAMDANPITLIVIAIAALVAAFVLLWTHSAAFRDFWIGLWHDIESVTMTVVDAVVGFFEGLYHDASALVGDVVGFVEGHWRLLLTILTGPIGLAVSLITKYWSDIKHWFQDGVNAVGSILSWFGSLPGKFGSWLGGVVTAVGQKIGDVLNWFRQLPSKILSMLSDAGSWLLNIGEQIINGLIHGVENMAGQAVQAVENVGHDLIGAAKSVLSIFSPSKEFASIGEMTMAGMVQGIAGAAPTVNTAMRNAMKGLTGPSITASVVANAQATGTQLGVAVASGLGGAASTGSAASGNTYITVEGGNTLMSDSDFDKFAQKVGQRVVQSIGPQGGVKTLLR